MEKSSLKSIILKYGISFLVATGIFFLVISVREIYTVTDTQQIYRFLSDGFVVPAAVFLCLGTLIWIANFGVFTGIGYAIKHAVLMLIPLSKKKHETYADYRENKQKVTGFAFLFVIGVIFLIPGVVFAILF